MLSRFQRAVCSVVRTCLLDLFISYKTFTIKIDVQSPFGLHFSLGNSSCPFVCSHEGSVKENWIVYCTCSK